MSMIGVALLFDVKVTFDDDPGSTCGCVTSPPVTLVIVRFDSATKSRPWFSILIMGEERAITDGAARPAPPPPDSLCARIETLPADTIISPNAKALPDALAANGACWIRVLIWRWI